MADAHDAGLFEVLRAEVWAADAHDAGLFEVLLAEVRAADVHDAGLHTANSGNLKPPMGSGTT